jgi:DNA replication protein DnaD
MSDEVSQFLEQVERLRGQQIEEDETRARELEEYLAAKRERQARREGEKNNQKKTKKKERERELGRPLLLAA